MSAPTFDQHVNEALALVAPAHRPVNATRPARSASTPQHGRPRLALVPRRAAPPRGDRAVSATPSTHGRRNQEHSDTPENEPAQTPETGSGMPDDETRLRSLLSRIGVRPLGHAEQLVDEQPEPAVARLDQDLEAAGATRRIAMSPGGRLSVPGQTIELGDLPEQQVPTMEPMPAEGQDATADPAGPPEAQPAGESPNSTWQPCLPWRRRKNDDQAEGPAAADEDLTGLEGEGPDWFRVRKTADAQAPDPDPYEVHNHFYGTGQELSAPAGEGAGPGRNHSSLTVW